MVDEVKDELGIESMTQVVVSAAVAYVAYTVGAGFSGDGGFFANMSAASTSSAAAGAAAAGAASSALGQALAEKPNLPDSDFNSELKRNINTRQPINFRETVYGRVFKGGPIVFMETNDDEDVMYLVIMLASHEIEGVESIKFNDSQFVRRSQDNWHTGLITNDGGDLGAYSDEITQVYVHKGNGNASIPSSFTTDTSLNSGDHKFHDMATLFVRMKFDADVWAAGFPAITVVMKGKKIQPIGGGTARWSNNPAEVIQDYLLSEFGLELSTSDIDSTSFADSRDYANQIVDRDTAKRGTLRHIQDSGSVYVVDKSVSEFRPLRDGDKINFVDGDAPSGLSSSADYYVASVTTPYRSTGKMQQGIRLATSLSSALSGSFVSFTAATSDSEHSFDRIGEKRFSLDGVTRTDRTHKANMQDMLSSFGGELVVSNGKFKLLSPQWVTPQITLDEDDMLSSIEFRAKPTKDVRINTVTGKLFAPEFNWGAADMEKISVSSFVTADGDEITQDFDFLFCTNPAQAQRVAKLVLLKSRNDKGISFTMPISGLRFDVGDRFQLNNERLGFTNSNPLYLRIKSLQVIAGGPTVPMVKIDAVEDNSTVYDWDETTDEIVVDPFPDRVLPDATAVPSPTGLSISENTTINDDGSNLTKIVVVYNVPPSNIMDVVLVLQEYDFDDTNPQYLSSQSINVSARQATKAEFTTVSNGRYRVIAYNTSYYGVRSAAATSNVLNLSGDTVAPSPPSSLTATGGYGYVSVAWTNPTDADFKDVIIYRLNVTTQAYEAISSTQGESHVDAPLGFNVTYSYKLKSRDYSGNQSDFTDVVTATTSTEVVESPRTAQGYIYYSSSSANAPAAPAATDFGDFDYTTGTFASLPTGWQLNPTNITISEDKFWAVRWGVEESEFGGTQTVEVSTVFNWLNFDGVVTFTNLQSELSGSGTNITTIDGGLIATDSITADSIDVTDLSSIKANLGTVTAGKLQSSDGLFVIDLDNKFIYIQ